MKPGMIKVSAYYPAGEGNKFDMEYYLTKHVPMVIEATGGAAKHAGVEQGLAGGAPDSPPMFMAVSHFYFDSMEVFQTKALPNLGGVLADTPNFTNTEPTLQIGAVML